VGIEIEPVAVSRKLLLLLIGAAAVLAVALHDERTSSFCAGLAAGAGAVFVISFIKRKRGS
jgi:hypothetical protein